MVDADTLAKLTYAQSQLDGQVQNLEKQLATIAAIEAELTADSLTLEECLCVEAVRIFKTYATHQPQPRRASF